MKLLLLRFLGPLFPIIDYVSTFANSSLEYKLFSIHMFFFLQIGIYFRANTISIVLSIPEVTSLLQDLALFLFVLFCFYFPCLVLLDERSFTGAYYVLDWPRLAVLMAKGFSCLYSLQCLVIYMRVLWGWKRGLWWFE